MEALLAFGPDAPPDFAEVLWPSRTGDLGEAAANLFAMLRRLDRPCFTGIAVMPIPEYGSGRAINDRLRRATAPRGSLTSCSQRQRPLGCRRVSSTPTVLVTFLQHIFINIKNSA